MLIAVRSYDTGRKGPGDTQGTQILTADLKDDGNARWE